MKIGDKIRVWWKTPDENQPNLAKILAILPYRGLGDYDCVLRLEAPNTRRGYTEMAFRKSDFKYCGVKS